LRSGVAGRTVSRMPATLNDIRAATDRVQAADTQLEELAAMVDLERLVKGLSRHLFRAAYGKYTMAEIARAVGTSRQAVSQQRQRQQQRADGPAPLSTEGQP